jgi:hypothetical protein
MLELRALNRLVALDGEPRDELASLLDRFVEAGTQDLIDARRLLG